MKFVWKELRDQSVIFEDDHCLVLNKPSGISVMGERNGPDVVSLAGDDNEELFPAHRIDKITSGVIAFAKDSKSHGPLTRQFAKRQVQKQYLALVVGSESIKKVFNVDLPLMTASSGRVRIAAERNSIIFSDSNSSYKIKKRHILKDKKIFPSVTKVKTLLSHNDIHFVSLIPETGRRHQLRVHMAWIGFPILGDPLFKSTSESKNYEPNLHSFRLKIHLPWSGDAQLFEAPLPEQFIANFL